MPLGITTFAPRFSLDIEPGDIVERVLAYDFVLYQLEVSRDRILLANVMRTNQYKGLCEVLTPLIGLSQAKTLSEGWLARKPDGTEEVNKVLASAGLSMDTVMAQTFSVELGVIERMNRIIEIKERRRNSCLHEIFRHRETLGQTLRRALQKLEEGQLRVSTAHPSMGRNPSDQRHQDKIKSKTARSCSVF